MPSTTSAASKRKVRSTAAAAEGSSSQKENGGGAPTVSKKPAKKRKKQVEVDVDGDFVFKRRKSTRLTARAEVAEPAPPPPPPPPPAPPAPAPAIANDEVETVGEIAPTRTAPKPKASRAQLPLDSPTPQPRVTKKRRAKEKERSEVEDEPQPPPSSPPPKPKKKVQKRRHAQEDVEMSSASVVTQDSSSIVFRTSDDSTATTKIQLPTSDTPMQRRNQELRKGPGGGTAGGRRRSSLGMRGRRASSMLASGIVAEPHAEISHTEFYKHIGSEEMENARMKQLLSWSGRRALDAVQNAPPVPDDPAYHIARVIDEEVLKEFATNGALSTWFTRADSPAPTAVKKPNPKNEENREALEKLQKQLEELDSEHSAWLSLRDMSIPDLKLPKTESEFTTFLRPSEQAFAASTAEAHDVVAEVQRVVKNQVSDIAFQIDRLADGVHRLLRYGEAADELANDVLSTAAEARHRAASRIRSKAATEALPLHEVLRAISYTNSPSTALLPQPGGAP